MFDFVYPNLFRINLTLGLLFGRCNFRPIRNDDYFILLNYWSIASLEGKATERTVDSDQNIAKLKYTNLRIHSLQKFDYKIQNY